MRISDLSSDVCSSDLLPAVLVIPKVDHVEQVFVVASLLRGKYPSILPMIEGARGLANAAQIAAHAARVGLLDRKRDVQGKSVSVRVDLGGPRIIKNKHTHKNPNIQNCHHRFMQ